MKNQIVFEAMNIATKMLVSKITSQWGWGRFNTVDVKVRHGSGKATNAKTYYNIGRATITYGSKMIQDKRRKANGSGWTTGREVVTMGFYNGELTYTNLIAHTVLHEVAHVVNCITTNNTGRPHGPSFYRVLRQLHKDFGALVKQTVISHAGHENLQFSPTQSKVYTSGDVHVGGIGLHSVSMV